MHNEQRRPSPKAKRDRAEGHGDIFLLLFALLMQSAAAQQTVTTTKGLNMGVPDTQIELKWLVCWRTNRLK